MILCPIVLCACETWATTKTDVRNLAGLERKVLPQMSVPKRNQNTNEDVMRRVFDDSDVVATM